MRSKKFWLDTAERAIKTIAQTLLATLAVGTAIWDVAWVEALGISATAAVISVLTSIVSVGAGDKDSASLVTKPTI